MQSRAAGDAPRAAIYCRLSEEDADKADPGQDSRSIQNQKSMLVRYAVEQGWQIYNIYSDDDYTGSDRERPQFNRLLEDARRGCFDIVLCKSQSRFTREMELVEKYIHGLFVEWSVRFVGYADNADTANRGNKKARQINGLVNEWYLEDMSQNIRTVLDAKRRQGEFVGSLPLRIRKDPGQTPPACWTSRRRWCGASMRCTFRLGRPHCGTAQPGTGAESQRIQKQKQPGFSTGAAHRAGRALSDSTVLGILKKQVYTGNHCAACQRENQLQKAKRHAACRPERRAVVQEPMRRSSTRKHGRPFSGSWRRGSGEREGRRDAGGQMLRGAVRRKAKQIRPCGKIPAVPHHAVAPGGCEHPADEAAQCVLEALQTAWRGIWTGMSPARHLRSPEAVRTGRNSLALRAAWLNRRWHASAPAAKRCMRTAWTALSRLHEVRGAGAAFEAEIASWEKELAAAERERVRRRSRRRSA